MIKKLIIKWNCYRGRHVWGKNTETATGWTKECVYCGKLTIRTSLDKMATLIMNDSSITKEIAEVLSKTNPLFEREVKK